ncbi:aldo/keto reductase [Actinomyces sp. F1_1611]
MGQTITLRDGTELPSIGFGTYPLRGTEAVEAVQEAISVGYRMIDTAFNYDNEAAVGRGLAESGIPREQLTVVSKLPGRFHRRPGADHAVKESLWRLNLDYLDVYLIHWPNPIHGHFVEAWEALLAAQAEGLVRTVGVSNFTVEQLQELQRATGVLPTVNQIECHPYFPQEQQLAAHRELGIQTISWSPLGKAAHPADEPVIQEIARAHRVTPAQVVLRWQVQRGSIPIPKTKTPARMVENLDIFGFTLTEEELGRITALGRPDGRLFDGDPNVHEEM